VQQHALRAYDAVQLASAVRFQRKSAALQAMRLTFVTADNQLLAAAKAEGLLTMNPLEEAAPR
jgi:predicted nucleic acid-binding protein